MTGFLNVVRQMEIERRDRHGKTNKRAANNGWKGHVPALLQEGAGLIVADASKHEHLVRRGYVRLLPQSRAAGSGSPWYRLRPALSYALSKDKHGSPPPTVVLRPDLRQDISRPQPAWLLQW